MTWINFSKREPDKFEPVHNSRGYPAYYIRALAERDAADKEYYKLCDIGTPEQVKAQLVVCQQMDEAVSIAFDRYQRELQEIENE